MKPIGRRAFLTRSAAAIGAGAGGLAAAKLARALPRARRRPPPLRSTASEEWQVSQAELGVVEPFNGPTRPAS